MSNKGYVIGYMNSSMDIPTIVYGPFTTLEQTKRQMPESNKESYKIYALVEVNRDNQTLKDIIEELYKN